MICLMKHRVGYLQTAHVPPGVLHEVVSMQAGQHVRLCLEAQAVEPYDAATVESSALPFVHWLCDIDLEPFMGGMILWVAVKAK